MPSTLAHLLTCSPPTHSFTAVAQCSARLHLISLCPSPSSEEKVESSKKPSLCFHFVHQGTGTGGTGHTGLLFWFRMVWPLPQVDFPPGGPKEHLGSFVSSQARAAEIRSILCVSREVFNQTIQNK